MGALLDFKEVPYKNEEEWLLSITMNLYSGLSVEDLTENEIHLLEKHYGEHWKDRFGR